MVDKLPRHAKPLGHSIRERLHAEGLRGVVAGVKEIRAHFFGQRVGVVRPFAGDESVHAFANSLRDFATRVDQRFDELNRKVDRYAARGLW